MCGTKTKGHGYGIEEQLDFKSMGLLYLIIIGAIFGWLAAIILQDETRPGLTRNIGAGFSGAIVTGVFLSPAIGGGSLLGGTYSVTALLLSLFGSVVAIILANVLRTYSSIR